ncbi:hypothetical protein AMAG_14612 [Allomyces macrogynus ATCC 38327]|uniref:PHD-type domain-containing protein n=1 Tax=Allomyces macrogynus (strain ATCC 38327) TaxID=578462 RepID=A0A0L0T6U0_ALLM3|nr:hypothetical protein AMAG_14612 [Allomyces macrogynus ATCC 38327]|eukprot:KNE70488.1 hypothetical protein AMAG_14612 [Allomyces macrogynus ATCC 38327]
MSADSADLLPPSTPTTSTTKPARPRGRPARAAANAAPAASTNTAAHPLDAALKALESGNSTRPSAPARTGSASADPADTPAGAGTTAATTTTGSACAICRRGEDADDDFLQDWVMCDYCDEWLHPVCLLTPLADSPTFILTY